MSSSKAAKGGTKKKKKAKKFVVGKRVSVECEHGTERGEVQFVGETEFDEGIWVGVALDKPNGDHDGCVDGVSYFTCKAKRGVFVRESACKALKTVKKKKSSAVGGDGDAQSQKKTGKKKKSKAKAKAGDDAESKTSKKVKILKKKSTVGEKKKKKKKAGTADSAAGTKKIKSKKSVKKTKPKEPKAKKTTSERQVEAADHSQQAQGDVAPKEPHELLLAQLNELSDSKLQKFAVMKGLQLAADLDRPTRIRSVLHHIYPHLALADLSSSDDSGDERLAQNHQESGAEEEQDDGVTEDKDNVALNDSEDGSAASGADSDASDGEGTDDGEWEESDLELEEGHGIEDFPCEDSDDAQGNDARSVSRDREAGSAEAEAELHKVTAELEISRRLVAERDATIKDLQHQLRQALEDGALTAGGPPPSPDSIVLTVYPGDAGSESPDEGHDAQYWKAACRALQTTLEEQQRLQTEALADMLRTAHEMSNGRNGSE